MTAEEEHFKFCQELVRCFHSFEMSLGKSLQGWDSPRLHKLRDHAQKVLESNSPLAILTAEPVKGGEE